MARRRKMTVNDRIDLILQGNMSDLGMESGLHHDQVISEDDPHRMRLQQMSKLYNASIEDRLLKVRTRPSSTASSVVMALTKDGTSRKFPLSPIQTPSASSSSLTSGFAAVVKPLELSFSKPGGSRNGSPMLAIDEGDNDSPPQTPVIFKASAFNSGVTMAPITAGAAVVPEAFVLSKTPSLQQSRHCTTPAGAPRRSILMSPIKQHANQQEELQREILDDEPLSASSSTITTSPARDHPRIRRCRVHQRQRELGIHDDPDARPWYLTDPSHTPTVPVGSPEARIRRYGAFGTAKMMAKETSSGTAPLFELHNKSQSLSSLKKDFTPIAYVPQLGGSPSLWPQDADVTPGSPLRFDVLRNVSPAKKSIEAVRFVGAKDDQFLKLQEMDAQAIGALESELANEKQRRLQQITESTQEMKHWRKQMRHFHHLDHEFYKVSNKKSAKSMTILYTPSFESETQDSDEMLAKQRRRFELKWQNMAFLLDAMKKTTCRRPVIQDLEKLYQLSWELCVQSHGNSSSATNHGLQVGFGLTRLQFWNLFSMEYPSLEFCHAMRLFSSFDPTFQDQLDFRLFVATLRAMRVQQGTPLEILVFGFRDLDVTKTNVVTRPHFELVVTMCCASRQELESMQQRVQAFWQEFVVIMDKDQDAGSVDQIAKALEQESGLLHEFTSQLLARRRECLSGVS